MDKSLNFRKNFIWNILGTGFNAFNSLFLMIIVTRVNGVDEAGIFAIAFATACILYVIGTYAGRIFQVTENDKNISDKDYIANRLICCILMMICTVLFVFIRGYDYYKCTIFIILALYKALDAFSDVLYGVMQKNDLLYKVGQSFFIKALLTITVFTAVDVLTKDLGLACLSIVVVWFIVMITFDLYNTKKLMDFTQKINWINAIKIFKTGFFIFAIAFLGLYVMNAPKYAIDSLLANDMQTIFGVIVMPATAISLLGQFLIHPYLTRFVQLNKDKDYNQLKKLEFKLVIYIVIFGTISTVLAYFIGIPILELIYGIDLTGYSVMLTIIIIASTIYNVGMIYSNILTTMRHTFIQFIIYTITTIIALAISGGLTRARGIEGACIAYFVIMLSLFVFYFVVEKVILNKERRKVSNER